MGGIKDRIAESVDRVVNKVVEEEVKSSYTPEQRDAAQDLQRIRQEQQAEAQKVSWWKRGKLNRM